MQTEGKIPVKRIAQEISVRFRVTYWNTSDPNRLKSVKRSIGPTYRMVPLTIYGDEDD